MLNISKTMIAVTALMFSAAVLPAYNQSTWSNPSNGNTSYSYSPDSSSMGQGQQGFTPVPGQSYNTPEAAPAPSYQPGYRMNKPATASTLDEEILKNLRLAIQNDSSLSNKARNLQFDSNNGIVTFTGEVRDDAEKAKIERLAKQIPGVRSVSTSITVITSGAPAAPVTDEAISDSIRFTLKHDFSLSEDAKGVSVNVDQGTVTLSGTVKNEMEKAKIESLTKSTTGVKNINNKINVRNQSGF